MKETKKIRHGVYEYIESQFGKLTPEQRGVISSAIQDHSDNRNANLKVMARQHALVNDKISVALKKANKLSLAEKNPRIIGQVEVLELVKNWLNTDAE